MDSKWRYILGSVTIVTIIGVTIYAIKKSKDMEKTEGEEITFEEAREIVSRRRTTEEKALDSQEFGEMVDDIRDHASWNRSFSPYEEEEEESSKIKVNIRPLDTDENETYLGVDFDGDAEDEEDVEDEYTINFEVPFAETITEEDKELRYDPNSLDAREQYIRMELAEWAPREDIYQTLLKLFDFPFNPENDGDADLKYKLIDYRAGFFGNGSKWITDISYAEVILHYARVADFNVGEGYKYWVEYFLRFNQLSHRMSSSEIDDVLIGLNTHVYYNEENQTFGIFGLTGESMSQAISIANRNIDTAVTYEIEFNEFLKSCML